MPPKKPKTIPRVNSRRKSKSSNTAATGLYAASTLLQNAVANYSKSLVTTQKYAQRIAQGRKWLKQLVESEESLEHPPGCPNLVVEKEWTAEDLAGAFGKTPTPASAYILSLLISSKCFGEECGKSTAEGFHAAWKQHWDKAEPVGKWQGRWTWNDEKECYSGNPASSPEVDGIIKAVKNRDGSEGMRNHSSAMRKEWMDTIIEWSEKEVPNSMLHTFWEMGDKEYFKALPVMVKHFMMRAFSTSGFTLWTRNFELANLKYKNLELELQTTDQCRSSYFRVSLEDRKNWRHHTTREDILHGHNYEVHDQPESPGINMYFHFLRWLEFLELYIYRRALQPEDYVFPAIRANGVAKPGTPIPHDTIQKWLDEFVLTAEVKIGKARLTTPCFRRGGAQYRFAEAPVGKRWSLSVVKWWGGWAQGEHRDAMLRYLVDELHHFEEGHGDALRPCLPEESKSSLLGEHEMLQVPSKLEIQQMFRSEVAAATHTVFQGCEKLLNLLQGPDVVSIATSGTLPSLLDKWKAQECQQVFSLTTVPMAERWRQVIKDWYHSDLSWNHYIALKDWRPKWVTELRGILAQKYYDRKLIVQQYEQCNSNDSEFLQQWPVAAKGPTALLSAINEGRQAAGAYKCRASKNGKPEERKK
ncbi:hypothetical protein M422DRAFT_256981 [Sphaerobolus stellatus SS14]|uniref:Uncharacterized protein n=1 Tax=Sphaerobolus stellatus (strain SS14) TaxID=990650 RepID=A0A0C9VFC4_SPHS4|nr:hypothetical protein M422DRAFT_256981 [Sphaerobolus stellatus SS14]